MNPADVQQRADAEIGAAWRRARAAAEGNLSLIGDDKHARVTATPASPNRIRFVDVVGSDEVDALDALARILEAGCE